MGKTKSVALLVVIAILLALLTAMTFLSFHIPFYKEGVVKYNSLLSAVDLDVDLEGGYSYTLTLDESSDDVENVSDVVSTLAGRLNALGYSNYRFTLLRETADDEYAIRMDLKGKSSHSQDVEAVVLYGQVEIRKGDEVVAEGSSAIKNAYYYGAQNNGGTVQYPVALEFTDSGYDAMKAVFDEDGEASLSIVLAGDDKPTTLLDKYTKSNLAKKVFVTAETEEAAIRLAMQIRTGGLSYKYNLSDAYKIEPVLGVKASTLVFFGSLAFVLVVMVLFGLFYKGLGLAADVSLLTQILLQVLMLRLVPGITLGMGGVIGLMGAFALSALTTLVFVQKFKAEYESGKTLRAANQSSFRKYGLVALDTHVAAGAVALGLFFFAGHAVKGFAATFGIGLSLSLLTSVLFTHALIGIVAGISNGSEAFLGISREA